MNLKNKTICIVDNGLALHLAEFLTDYYGKVLYYVPSSGSYPTPDQDCIGTGIKGVERIYNLHKYIFVDPSPKDIVDIFFFPDIGFSSLQEHLRELGYRVCGSGDADKLETDKSFFQKSLEEVGLPTAKTIECTGITELKAYLKGKPSGECFVKVSQHRGLMETYKWRGDFLSSSWIADLTCRLGNHAESQLFLVQHKIDAICEIGTDGFSLDGQIPENCMFGIEIKDAGYIGKVVKDQPDKCKEVNDLMEPVIKKLGMRGHYSTEIRVSKDKKPYYIDSTNRTPSPPGELMPFMYENYAEAIWSLGEGKLPVLKPSKHKYGAEVIVRSSWLEHEHWLPISLPEGTRVRLKNHCVKNGKTYCTE